MKIKSPFSDKLIFEEYLKLFYEKSNYDLATEIRDDKMSSEELKIYRQRYEKFSEKYKLQSSTGGAGMVIKSNNAVKTPYKLYINPGINTLEFAELIINKCKEKNLDYVLKVITPDEANIRCEKLVIYGSSAKNISELYDLVNELIKENNSIPFGKLPIFSDNIDGKIGFGYDNLELKKSYNNWMSDAIRIACKNFSEMISKELPKEYISNFSHRANIRQALKDFPELQERFRSYLNKSYINTIKTIPGIEQLSNTEKLPENASWKLNSKSEYVLIITDPKNRTCQTYSARVASKKFGITPPNELTLKYDGKVATTGEIYNSKITISEATKSALEGGVSEGKTKEVKHIKETEINLNKTKGVTKDD